MKSDIFYRAFAESVQSKRCYNPFYHGTRRPKSMPLHIHEWTDQWFNEHFQIKARSSCIFVACHRADVEQYATAETSVIRQIHFPEHARYIYSVDVKDLVVSVDQLQQQLVQDISREDVEQLLARSDYRCTQDPFSIPDDAGEVMVFCEYYDVV